MMAKTCASLVVILLCGVVVKDVLADDSENKFSCDGRASGYYADLNAGCQVYHMCDGLGRQFSYSCPNTTLFQQRMLICDHWYMVNCSQSELDYGANLLIGQRDKPFVDDSSEHPYHRTPRPDLLTHPYAPRFQSDYRQGKSQFGTSQNLVGVETEETNSNATDGPVYFLPSHWSTQYIKRATTPLPPLSKKNYSSKSSLVNEKITTQIRFDPKPSKVTKTVPKIVDKKDAIGLSRFTLPPFAPTLTSKDSFITEKPVLSEKKLEVTGTSLGTTGFQSTFGTGPKVEVTRPNFEVRSQEKPITSFHIASTGFGTSAIHSNSEAGRTFETTRPSVENKKTRQDKPVLNEKKFDVSKVNEFGTTAIPSISSTLPKVEVTRQETIGVLNQKNIGVPNGITFRSIGISSNLDGVPPVSSISDKSSRVEQNTESNSKIPSIASYLRPPIVQPFVRSSSESLITNDIEVPSIFYQPPKLTTYYQAESTTMDPQTFYKLVPSKDLLPPKLKPPSDEKLIQIDSTTTTRSVTKKDTTNPALLPPVAANSPSGSEKRWKDLRQMFFIPEYDFPLDLGSRPGYESGLSSFQAQQEPPNPEIKPKEASQETKCDLKCDPAFLTPGTCKPCVTIR